MAKILLFLIWPAGMAVIFGVAALLARRVQPRPPGRGSAGCRGWGTARRWTMRTAARRSGGPSGRPLSSSGSSSSGPP